MTTITEFQNIHIDQQNIVIVPALGTLSSVFDCGGTQLCGFYAPYEIRGSNVTFISKNRPEALNSFVYDGGATPVLVNYPVPLMGAGENAYIPVSLTIFAGIRYVQLVMSDPVTINTRIELAVRPT